MRTLLWQLASALALACAPICDAMGEPVAVLLRNATVLDGRGNAIEGGSVLIAQGRIEAIGKSIQAPPGAKIEDAAGKWVTPGIIDVHSHLGADAMPHVPANDDGGEETSPIGSGLRIEESIWPQDPGFSRALAGGVTAMQILPASTNLIGGRTVVLRNIPARTVREMKFPGAPYGIKMACGENPKRSYGSKGRAPSTRMGNFAGFRAAWIKAQAYVKARAAYESARAQGVKDSAPPPRDLDLEALADVLDGTLLVHIHCYRADEMALVLDMAQEFGYRIGTFHHAAEAYKIADLLTAKNVCVAMWADWWGLSMEMYDGIQENIALMHRAGACAILHSDSVLDIQRMNQEVAKARAAGNRMGLGISRGEAWQWISYNAAKSLGIEASTGSLEAGKMADVVIWDGDPFSVYTHAEKVFIEGELVFDRTDAAGRRISDFELGQARVREID